MIHILNEKLFYDSMSNFGPGAIYEQFCSKMETEDYRGSSYVRSYHVIELDTSDSSGGSPSVSIVYRKLSSQYGQSQSEKK